MAGGSSSGGAGRLKEAFDCERQFDVFAARHEARVAAANTKKLSAADRIMQLRERVAAEQPAAAASRAAGATETGGACTPVSPDRLFAFPLRGCIAE